MLRDRERARQTRRLDAQQVHQARHTVVGGALDEEVGRGLARAADLGPNAGVTGLQSTVGQLGPVAANLTVKRIATTRVHGQVCRVGDPLHVGAELGLAAQIQRQVHAQTGRFGHGVNQARKRRLARQGEVVAFGEMGMRQDRSVQTLHGARQGHGVQAGGVDQFSASQFGAVLGAQHDGMTGRALRQMDGLNGRDQGQQATRVFQVALQSEHQAMAVNHTRAR